MVGPAAGIIAFALMFLSGLGGILLQTIVPRDALTPSASAWIRRGVTALILVAAVIFVIATVSLKASFNQADRDIKHLTSEIVEMDRSLRRIGPDAAPIRELLFRYTNRVMKDTWPELHARLPVGPTPAGELRARMGDLLAALPEGTVLRNDSIHEARLALADIIATRLIIFETSGSGTSIWVEAIGVVWLMLAFGTLGLIAPRSSIVVAALLLLSIVLGSAVFLLQEYDDPFSGVIIVSSAPMENALFQLAE